MRGAGRYFKSEQILKKKKKKNSSTRETRAYFSVFWMEHILISELRGQKCWWSLGAEWKKKKSAVRAHCRMLKILVTLVAACDLFSVECAVRLWEIRSEFMTWLLLCFAAMALHLSLPQISKRFCRKSGKCKLKP